MSLESCFLLTLMESAKSIYWEYCCKRFHWSQVLCNFLWLFRPVLDLFLIFFKRFTITTAVVELFLGLNSHPYCNINLVILDCYNKSLKWNNSAVFVTRTESFIDFVYYVLYYPLHLQFTIGQRKLQTKHTKTCLEMFFLSIDFWPLTVH